MNARSIVLIGAVAILGIGAIMIISSLFSGPQPVRRTQIAVASQSIEPYTIITQDMIGTSEDVLLRDAEARGAWQPEFAVGLMTRDRIRQGDWITAQNAQSVEDVRFAEDLGLEVLTFQAGLDKTVGGEIRPGHLVNLYGTGRTREGEPFTRLIEPQVWVVDVSAAGQPVSNATLVPDQGELRVEGGDQQRATSTVTVAVRPDQAYNIINALGAENLQPWVTLAASQTAASVLATPVPLPTNTAGLPPDIAATATWIAGQLAPTVPPIAPGTGGGGQP